MKLPAFICVTVATYLVLCTVQLAVDTVLTVPHSEWSTFVEQSRKADLRSCDCENDCQTTSPHGATRRFPPAPPHVILTTSPFFSPALEPLRARTSLTYTYSHPSLCKFINVHTYMVLYIKCCVNSSIRFSSKNSFSHLWPFYRGVAPFLPTHCCIEFHMTEYCLFAATTGDAARCCCLRSQNSAAST